MTGFWTQTEDGQPFHVSGDPFMSEDTLNALRTMMSLAVKQYCEPAKEKETMSGWIGVDLDGTLAFYGGWKPGEIGDPVPAMVERVKKWLAEDRDVRIFTARVAVEQFAAEERALIEAWCVEHIGRKLPITCVKDFAMEVLFDDRAIQVEMNTGRLIREPRTTP